MKSTSTAPFLHRAGRLIVRGKKRYSPFGDTDLGFLLDRRLQVDTLILAGINTTSCVLCCSFEATNRDYRVVIVRIPAEAAHDSEMMSPAIPR